MEYRFENGNARMEHRVSPNGTPEVVIHLMPKDDEGNQSRSRTHDLYQEVSAWVKTEKNVEHTVLLSGVTKLFKLCDCDKEMKEGKNTKKF